MKTTLEIPDQIFRTAQATASALGIPLREFVTQAVGIAESRHREAYNKAAAANAGPMHRS